MISIVQVRSRQGDLFNLPLEDDSSGFRVANIDGLDPVKATLVSSSFANSDGEVYQSSRRETRNIKFNIELDPDPETNDTVRDLRKKLFRFFMPELTVKLTFVLEEGLTVDIVGVVESCETDHFSQEPAVDISIICFDPDFYDPVPVLVEGMTTADTTPRAIDYEGTVPTGVKFVLLVDRPISDFSIYHTPIGGEARTLEFSMALLAGDSVLISTIPGEKEARLVRAGVSSSVLYAISPQSNWIGFEPGINEVQVQAEGAGIPLTFEYISKYGGL